MSAVSLHHYHRALNQWPRLVAFLGLLWLLALLAFAVGGLEIGPTAPGEGILVGPFRWDAIGAAEG